MLEARMGIEPIYTALQGSPWPLRYRNMAYSSLR